MTRRKSNRGARYRSVPVGDVFWRSLHEQGGVYGMTASSFASLILRNFCVKDWPLHAVPQHADLEKMAEAGERYETPAARRVG